MNSQQQLDWLHANRALVNFGLTDVTIWCVPYAYVVAETLEEAIVLMMERMGVVEGMLSMQQALLLAEPQKEKAL